MVSNYFCHWVLSWMFSFLVHFNGFCSSCLLWWQIRTLVKKEKKRKTHICVKSHCNIQALCELVRGGGLKTHGCFCSSHELHLHRVCKRDTLSCRIYLTPPFFRYLIIPRRIVPPLANLHDSSMWSPVNRTYQSKYLIRTRPAAKHEALMSWLKLLWLLT